MFRNIKNVEQQQYLLLQQQFQQVQQQIYQLGILNKNFISYVLNYYIFSVFKNSLSAIFDATPAK